MQVVSNLIIPNSHRTQLIRQWHGATCIDVLICLKYIFQVYIQNGIVEETLDKTCNILLTAFICIPTI